MLGVPIPLLAADRVVENPFEKRIESRGDICSNGHSANVNPNGDERRECEIEHASDTDMSTPALSTIRPMQPKKPDAWSPPNTLLPKFDFHGLTIRPYRAADADQLFAVIDGSRTALLPWLPWAERQHLSPAASRDSIHRFSMSLRDPLAPENNRTFGFVFGVFDGSTGELLAGTGFNRIDVGLHNAETGYWVRADRRREGIATRTLAATLSWGFTPQAAGGFGFRRVHIFAADGNLASCGVPRKLGLQETMRTRGDRWLNGIGWCGTIGWEVLADEWDSAAGIRLHSPS